MRAVLLAACLLISPGAQAAETLLHLAETASVSRSPDQINATLSAQAAAPTPQDAQAQVNRATAAGLASAGKVPDVQVATGAYRTWRVPPPQTGWQAEQSISLTAGKDAAPALLALLGHLQQSGLTTTDLSWTLSAAQLTSAQDEALQKAIAALQGKAEQAAALLHLHFTGFRSVDVAPEFAPRPMPMMAMRANMVEPSAVPQDTDVTATIDAQAILSDAAPVPH
jgi:uncharacterized protein